MIKNTNKQPYKPVPYREGNKVLRIYDVPFVDSVGNKALVTKCDFLDKKGNTNEGYDLRVKWLEEKPLFTEERKDFFLKAFEVADKDKYTSKYQEEMLVYFFAFEGKSYLSYWWEIDYKKSVTYMVFELSEDIIIPSAKDLLLEEVNFEKRIKRLLKKNYIKEFLAVEFLFGNEEENKKECVVIHENKKARSIFNKIYKKYCL